MAEEERHDKKN